MDDQDSDSLFKYDKIMNKEDTDILLEKTKKYYNLKNIVLCFCLGGGPLIAGYLISKNYKENGKEILGKITVILSIIFDINVTYNYFVYFHYHKIIFFTRVYVYFIIYILYYIIFKYRRVKENTNKFHNIKDSIFLILLGIVFKIIIYFIIFILAILLLSH
jgi:hypothetical protein